jgi:hypothetical protein
MRHSSLYIGEVRDRFSNVVRAFIPAFYGEINALGIPLAEGGEWATRLRQGFLLRLTMADKSAGQAGVDGCDIPVLAFEYDVLGRR